MYLEHYELSKLPFQLKPDPAFLYLGRAHARAKAYMDYTVWNRDGFVVITGEIGSGKTTLVQDLLSRLDDRVVVAKIHQTQLDDVEFLQALLGSFGIEVFDPNKARLLALLNRFLQGQHVKGRQVLLVVDEAQYLGRKVLEEIRFLAGIDMEGEHVFNCILVGHPELIKTLDAPEMEQLAQRVRLRFHLAGLDEEEVGEYIAHRLAVAGMPGQRIFPPETLPLIYEYTGGGAAPHQCPVRYRHDGGVRGGDPHSDTGAGRPVPRRAAVGALCGSCAQWWASRPGAGLEGTGTDAQAGADQEGGSPG